MTSITKQQLIERVIRFYNRYGQEINSIKSLLEIRLRQLSLAYALENDLPKSSIQVSSRVKTINSFLYKLERNSWPEFYYPTDVITDLIGGRIVCWFLDDCYGMLDHIIESEQFMVIPESVEDYIRAPKSSGYRSIHLLTNISYDRVKSFNNERRVVTGKMICEVQIRTKLQDAWGEFTHNVHYKVPHDFEDDYETLVSEIANRLASDDRSAQAIKNLLQNINKDKKYEGFKSGKVMFE